MELVGKVVADYRDGTVTFKDGSRLIVESGWYEERIGGPVSAEGYFVEWRRDDHDEWMPVSPGYPTMEDALEAVRERSRHGISFGEERVVYASGRPVD